MRILEISFLLSFSLILFSKSLAQSEARPLVNKDRFISLGVRSTFSAFDHDGAGLGTGGQFRIELSDRINTDWFADFITINVSDKVRSDYYHIGWSVLYYLLPDRKYPKLLQPYIVAGHCFDYNRKTAIADQTITKSRLGSAVQAGLGTHFNLSDKFDISLTCQYMIHLTKQLEADIDGNQVVIVEHPANSLEGHLLATASLNYKLFRLWTSK